MMKPMMVWCTVAIILAGPFLTGRCLAEKPVEIPVKGAVTLVDITSEDCQTCEEMLEVIEWVKKIYGKKVEIVMVDFWKNPQIVKQIGTNTMPTILIYDPEGNEVFRHFGFVNKQAMSFFLEQAGVE